MIKKELYCDTDSVWLGMNDYTIDLKLSGHNIVLEYVSEPPHGDSYHRMFIDGVLMRGYVWGCNFLFPLGQEFIVCSWMSKLYERKTVLINIPEKMFYTLEKYWYNFRFYNGILELTNNEFNDGEILRILEITEWEPL